LEARARVVGIDAYAQWSLQYVLQAAEPSRRFDKTRIEIDSAAAADEHAAFGLPRT